MECMREWLFWLLVGHFAAGTLAAGSVLCFFGIGLLKGIAMGGGSVAILHAIQEGVQSLWQRIGR